MKKNLFFLFSISVIILSCKKNITTQEEQPLLLKLPKTISSMPIGEQQFPITEITLDTVSGYWKNGPLVDGAILTLSDVQLRDGYAYAKLQLVDFGGGDYGRIVKGMPDGFDSGPFRSFAYDRSTCTITKSVSSRNWTSYVFTGKDQAGNTMVIVRDTLQAAYSTIPEFVDEFDIGEVEKSTNTYKSTRISYAMNCSKSKTIPFKIVATKDSQGVIHYFVANINYKEERIDPMIE